METQNQENTQAESAAEKEKRVYGKYFAIIEDADGKYKGCVETQMKKDLGKALANLEPGERVARIIRGFEMPFKETKKIEF